MKAASEPLAPGTCISQLTMKEILAEDLLYLPVHFILVGSNFN